MKLPDMFTIQKCSGALQQAHPVCQCSGALQSEQHVLCLITRQEKLFRSRLIRPLGLSWRLPWRT